MDLDEGDAPEPLRQREIEENLWRAIRHGMDGEMIDFRDRRVVPTRAVLEGIVEWTEPARRPSGSRSSCRSGTAPSAPRTGSRRGRRSRRSTAGSRGDPPDLRAGGSRQWKVRAAAAEEAQLSEEELRAQLEEEIRKVRVEDVVLQSVVSILNLSARRIAKDDERDLAQAKLGIDAAARWSTW